MPSITVHRTADEVAAAAASMITDFVAGHPGPVTIGLSGGSTPEATYRLLADAPIEWDRVTTWLGDERWVPADHEDSNTAMVRRTLGAGARTLVAPDTSLADPETAAAAYDTALGEVFSSDAEGRPGMVLLGIGDDGHTASLFPGSDALGVEDRRYVENWVEDKDAWRLTATFPVLWSAHKVVFLVQGAGKAPIINRILEDQVPFPAQRVSANAPDVTWLLDEAAASQL